MLKYLLLGMALMLIGSGFAFGQDSIRRFDTVFISHFDDPGLDFWLSDSALTHISLQPSPVQQLQNAHFRGGSEALRGALAMVIGFGASTSGALDWYMPCIIRTNNPKLDWIHDIYCPGSLSKHTVKEKNGDNVEFQTEEVRNYQWDDGSLGYIIESGDTIGWHTVIIQKLLTDTVVQNAMQVVYSFPQFNDQGIVAQFAVKGMFAGEPSLMFYDTKSARLYVFRNGGLQCALQWQKPPKMFESRKKRQSQKVYLLVDPGVDRALRNDLFRLAAVGMRFRHAIQGY